MTKMLPDEVYEALAIPSQLTELRQIKVQQIEAMKKLTGKVLSLGVASLQAENAQLREALQRIANSSPNQSDGLGSAAVLSGIAWAALEIIK